MRFWIPLVRGIFALILGVVLILQPDKTRPVLANFMGMYWLASGLVSLRFTGSGRRARGVHLVAAAVGVLAGLGMLTRHLTASWAAEGVLTSLLGVVVLLTGAMHAFLGFREWQSATRHRTVTSTLLGIFEMVLGLALIISPLERGPVAYMAASIWALIGGIILIGDALAERRR